MQKVCQRRERKKVKIEIQKKRRKTEKTFKILIKIYKKLQKIFHFSCKFLF